MVCNHNLSPEYSPFECKEGDYIIIDKVKGIILKESGCSQENWTKWQNLWMSGEYKEGNLREHLKHGLRKNMLKYLKKKEVL